MHYKTGDLFTTELDVIGHGVNCQGVMGAGIAKIFRDRYRGNYRAYKMQCELRTLRPGGVFMFVDADDDFEGFGLDGERLIVNMASQNKPGADASYKWLFESANTAAGSLLKAGFDSMAIPQIGCGIGGLEWDEVEVILYAIEAIHDHHFNFEVWSL